MYRSIAAAAALLLATPALAQDAQPLPDPNDRSDFWQVAGGVGYTPDYEGSDDYRLIPAAALRARVSGIEISTNATYLYVDVVPPGEKTDILLGPIAGVRLNRSGKIKDDVVDRLPERNKAIEVGGFAGIAFKGLTNPYDSLTLRLDAVKDVGNAHESMVVTPNISFATPLSRAFFMSASLSADFVSDRFADYYFSVSPSDALASGLPLFDADGGMKNVKLGVLGNYALSGDLTKGLSIFATGHYSKLRGDFKRSPLVDQRGSASQWFAAAGLAYTF